MISTEENILSPIKQFLKVQLHIKLSSICIILNTQLVNVQLVNFVLLTNVVTKEQLTKLQLVNELYIMKAPRNELKENLTLMTSL